MRQASALPRVSCIIAVYNGASYLHEAIDSLLAQTYQEVEIVVVNDGSTDGTSDVIARYGDRIRVLDQPNLGVSTARNRGVAMSTGQFICFLDADDHVDPRKLALQVAAFQADAELEYCDCYTACFWSPELSQETCERDFRYPEPFWRKTLPGFILSWSFRRDLWDRVGGFQPQLRYAEDVDWISRARHLGMRQRTLPDVLAHRRLHPRNVTARNTGEHRKSLTNTIRAHLARKRSRVTA